MQLGVAAPRVGAVGVVAQQPQEERERLLSRGPAREGARHLPQKIINQGSEGGGHGLASRDGTREGFLEGVPPTGDPYWSGLRLSWLSSLHIMRISDAEVLTDLVLPSTPLVKIKVGTLLYPLSGLPIKQVPVGIHVCCLLRGRRRAALFLSCRWR